jgi:hypothetical protein
MARQLLTAILVRLAATCMYCKDSSCNILRVALFNETGGIQFHPLRSSPFIFPMHSQLLSWSVRYEEI